MRSAQKKRFGQTFKDSFYAIKHVWNSGLYHDLHDSCERNGGIPRQRARIFGFHLNSTPPS